MPILYDMLINKPIEGETSRVAGRHLVLNLVSQIDLEK